MASDVVIYFRMMSFCNAEVNLDLSLCYTPLPSFSVHALNGFPAVAKDVGKPLLSVQWVWLNVM